MVRHARNALSAAAVAAAALVGGCATTYDSAGNTYYAVWPFIGSRNPQLQLNYPVQTQKALQLGVDPNPLYFMYPQPPIDPRVTSPYSQAPSAPQTALAAVGDNAACAERCDAKETAAPVDLRAGAGDVRRIASR
jgi:hypothetical protein